jgi:acyl-CoA thioesterase FadM
LVTVHQEIAYLAALTAGDLVVMHGGVLSADRETLQFMHRMTRVEDGETVMTAKVLMLGMDLERRTSVALEEAILTRAKQLLVDTGHS